MLSTLLPLFLSSTAFSISLSDQTPLSLQSELAVEATLYDDIKVPVTLGVMSACPDALLCESIFDRVLKEVSDEVDLSLSFIGRADPDGKVTCLHGPRECVGNVHQLCAMKYAPFEWWDFVQCINHQGRHQVGVPEVAFKCAAVAGIDWEESGVGKCAGMDGRGQGEEGLLLLRESVENSRELGILKSCTMVINGHKACVHDGMWKECEGGHRVRDFVRQINEEYDRLNKCE